MNPADLIVLDDVEVDAEVEPEEKELTVCARLVLTEEQKTNNAKPTSLVTKMDLTDYLSGTAELSDIKEEEIVEENIQAPPVFNELQAKLTLTGEQKNDLREAFNLLDYTGEGKIKAEDFRVAIKALGYEPTKEELQKMIQGVDKGDTGKLSFENFETAIMRKIMSLDSDGDIMKSFRLFDMDDSGFISFENLKRVTEILGTYLTDEEIEEMLDDADKDFDGFISVAEFMKMIKTCVHIVTP